MRGQTVRRATDRQMPLRVEIRLPRSDRRRTADHRHNHMGLRTRHLAARRKTFPRKRPNEAVSERRCNREAANQREGTRSSRPISKHLPVS